MLTPLRKNNAHTGMALRRSRVVLQNPSKDRFGGIPNLGFPPRRHTERQDNRSRKDNPGRRRSERTSNAPAKTAKLIQDT